MGVNGGQWEAMRVSGGQWGPHRGELFDAVIGSERFCSNKWAIFSKGEADFLGVLFGFGVGGVDGSQWEPMGGSGSQWRGMGVSGGGMNGGQWGINGGRGGLMALMWGRGD